MYDYGNARVAARRGLLLTVDELLRMAESRDAAAALYELERRPEWRAAVTAGRQTTADPIGTLDATIERWRGDELRALPRWYEPPARRLVEACVLGLDRERLVQVVRRRRSAEARAPDTATPEAGTLLDAAEISAIEREPTRRGQLRRLVAAGIVSLAEARRIERAAPAAQPTEEVLGGTIDAGRRERAAGRGSDAQRVRALLAAELAERALVADELGTTGAPAAVLVERSSRLARLAGLAAAGRRDALGIGTVIGYVAAVELQAVRLRVVVQRVGGGWSPRIADAFLRAA